MHDDVPSFTEILSLWTVGQLTADLELPPSARPRVRQWRDRNCLPPKHWQRIIDMAERRHGLLLTPRHLMLAAAGQHRPIVKRPHFWTDEMDALLLRLSAKGISYRWVAARINDAFGTRFTRKSVYARLSLLRAKGRAAAVKQQKADSNAEAA